MVNDNVEYNAEEDIFYIYKKSEPIPIKGSLILDNLSFDISPSGDLVGMQIDGASEFFSTSPKILEGINKAKINIVTKGQTIMITWTVELENKVFNNKFVFPKEKIALSC